MTRDVLVTISGLHYDENIMEPGEEAEPIEVISPAVYYLKDGIHYIFYEEPVEGMPGTIKNKIKIKEGGFLEVTKSGLANTHMIFEKDKMNVTQYDTPYGGIVVGTYTRKLDVDVQEDRISVYAGYSLDVSGSKVAECDIRVKVESKLQPEVKPVG